MTVMVSESVAVLPELLVAETDTVYVPTEPEAGVPEIVAVPVPAVNVTPEGSVPDSVIVGDG